MSIRSLQNKVNDDAAVGEIMQTENEQPVRVIE